VELKSEVFFNVDKSDVLDATQEEEITKVAEYLKNNPQAKFIVNGYANKTSGTEEYNNALSKKRAVSVANTLIQKHAINFHRVQVRWFGGGVQPHRVPTMNQVVILKVVQ
jgi:outer membrane protein OmpA-like peptidoglycan-associated protein